MLDALRIRLRQGIRTLRFPMDDAGFPERFRGRPALESGRCGGECRDCAARMPSPLLRLEDGRAAALDLGACLFSPEEGP